MNYIIDANNLAGSLELLGENNFDKKLIEFIEDWLGEKQKTVVLVFDSIDPVGDRISRGFLEIIYSPRDGYHKTADDKILEIFEAWAGLDDDKRLRSDYSINLIERLVKDDLVFVSNDNDLREKVKESLSDIEENISLMTCDDFISLMERKDFLEEEESDERDLSEEEVEDINDEMMEIWGEK